jgi:hypothetical protein
MTEHFAQQAKAKTIAVGVIEEKANITVKSARTTQAGGGPEGMYD